MQKHTIKYHNVTITCTRRDGLADIPPTSYVTPPPRVARANTSPLSSLSLSLHAPDRRHRRIRLAVQGRPAHATEALLTNAILNIPIYTAEILT